jgi:uncharacterized Zn finger protein (UPF0148 family)
MSDPQADLTAMTVRELVNRACYVNQYDPSARDKLEESVAELERRTALRAGADDVRNAALDEAAETVVATPIPFQSQEQFDAALAHARRILAAIRKLLDPSPPHPGGSGCTCPLYHTENPNLYVPSPMCPVHGTPRPGGTTEADVMWIICPDCGNKFHRSVSGKDKCPVCGCLTHLRTDVAPHPEPAATATGVEAAWERLYAVWASKSSKDEGHSAASAELARLLASRRPSALVVGQAETVIRCAELDPSEWFPPKCIVEMARFVLAAR